MRLSGLKILAIVCGLLLAACAPSKATPENYAKVDWTLSRGQVYQLLGPPGSVTKRDSDVTGSGTTIETWTGRDQSLITITFVDDKVAMKTMHSDGKDY